MKQYIAKQRGRLHGLQDLPRMADLQASPAEVMEAFKRYPDDPMTMLETIREVAAAQEEVS